MIKNTHKQMHQLHCFVMKSKKNERKQKEQNMVEKNEVKLDYTKPKTDPNTF